MKKQGKTKVKARRKLCLKTLQRFKLTSGYCPPLLTQLQPVRYLSVLQSRAGFMQSGLVCVNQSFAREWVLEWRWRESRIFLLLLLWVCFFEMWRLLFVTFTFQFFSNHFKSASNMLSVLNNRFYFKYEKLVKCAWKFCISAFLDGHFLWTLLVLF